MAAAVSADRMLPETVTAFGGPPPGPARRPGERFVVASVQDEVGAGGREEVDDAGPDASRCARHDDDPVGKSKLAGPGRRRRAFDAACVSGGIALSASIAAEATSVTGRTLGQAMRGALSGR